MSGKYILRLKVFFCLMFFFGYMEAFSSAEDPIKDLVYYAGVKDTDFSLDNDCAKILTEIAKNYTKEFGIDFFRISEGKEVFFGEFESGKNFLVIYLNGNRPYFSMDKLKKDSLEISGREYEMWYDLKKGLILMGEDKLIVSNDFGKFLSKAENFEKKGYLGSIIEMLGHERYDYFVCENIEGEFYGKEYIRKISFKNNDVMSTEYYLKKKELLLDEIDLSGYIPKWAKVESYPGDDFLKKVLFEGLAGLELEPEFLESKLEELKPVASYFVSYDEGSYLLVYAEDLKKLNVVVKDLYSSLFFYQKLEVFSSDGYNFVEIPIFGIKKYFLKLQENVFALTDSMNAAISIKNGKYENLKYEKVDLNSLNFGNKSVKFYKDKIEVLER